MSRIIYTNIIACLLCCLPVLSFAQSLTRYEYWFDDKKKAQEWEGKLRSVFQDE